MKNFAQISQLSLALIAFFVSVKLLSQETNLKTGDPIPPFSAQTDEGTLWNSSEFKGKKNLVIYFYPAAMTGGCTAQACAYRDDQTALKELDAVVVGISGDDIKNLQLFREANQLNFTLLSDPDGNIAERFGVPVNKEMKTIEREVEGVKHLLSRQVTTSRWTFVIDKKGTLIYKSTQVNAAEDSKAVINVLEQQQ
jgi:peroxiredoxin Q/BCP